MEKPITIAIRKLHDDAIIPVYQTTGSSGRDLHSDDSFLLAPGEIRLVRTAIAIQLPEGYEGQIRSRSGLASKGIIVLNSPGTIDSDYTGEVRVLLMNVGKEGYTVRRYDRIAQLVIAKVERALIEFTSEITQTERGANGFGSTGK